MPQSQKSYLPSLDDILSSPTFRGLTRQLNPVTLFATATSVLNEFAAEARHVASERRLPDIPELAERIMAKIRVETPQISRPAINATGILFHPEYGAPAFANRTIEQMIQTLREGACEFEEKPVVRFDDPDAQEPLSKSPLKVLLCELTGAADATVFNSHTGAMLTLFSAFEHPGEVRQNVIHSVSDVCQWSDGSRLSDWAEHQWISPITIGAINETTVEDYENALRFEERGLLYGTDATNDCFQGQKHVPELEKLTELAKKYAVPLIYDTQWGTIHDMKPYGLKGIPVIKELIKQGVSLVVFSTCKLNGGPKLTVIAGDKAMIGKIRANRLHGSFVPNAYDITALETTLALSATRDRAEMEIPTYELLSTNQENLKLRADRIASQIAAVPGVLQAVPVFDFATLTPLNPFYQVPTWKIVVTLEHKSGAEVAKTLLLTKPGIAVGFSPGQPNQISVDLRTIFTKQDISLVETLISAVRS